MTNSNLPNPPDYNEPIPNEPFSDEDASSPFLSGPYSPLLLGEGLAYCGDYILSPTAIPAIPIGFLTAKGTIISALSCATPAPIALGQAGQVLTVDPTNTDTGISWCDIPNPQGYIPCSLFNQKGQLLVAVADDEPRPFNAGNSGEYLAVDPTSITGLTWCPSPYAEFTAPYQLVVSCSATCAIPLSGAVTGDVLYYDGNQSTGWSATRGDQLFVPQEGFSKGSLAVGCADNDSGKLALATGSDGYVLTADSNCALGVKWGCFSQTPLNTQGCCVVTPDAPNTNCYDIFSGTAFPEGSQVYVTLSGAWFGDKRQIAGTSYIVNGNDASYGILFDNTESRCSVMTLATSFVFTNWCNACPAVFVFDQSTSHQACVWFQASAFQLKP